MPPSIQTAISEKETEVLISQLQKAEENHLKWLAKLHEFLLCDAAKPLNVCEHDAHLHCDFGRWYYNELVDSMRSDDDLQEVGQVHEEMHAAARQLIHSWSQSHKIELNEYQAFIQQQQQLTLLITQIRDRLNVVLMSYDNLTGALRREAFMLLYEKEFLQSQRTNTEFCIAMVDLDFFKKVNDTYGHLVGDKVLQRTSLTISQGLRSYDSLCRFGGEEFVMLLPNTTLDEAKVVVERIRKKVERQVVITAEQAEVKTTISIGLVVVDNLINPDENLAHVDTELYRAKSEGRNKVCIKDV